MKKRSAALFNKAQNLFPGGVNSPVRAFKSVGSTPFLVEGGSGCELRDVDGNAYIDYVLSWGPLILGHAHPAVISAITEQAKKGTSYGACSPLESELAEMIQALVPSMEMMRFVSSGTEATMSAIRLARGHTGREKIIKFAGNYHGHADFLLAKSGSGLATFSIPDAAGVPSKATEDTLVLPYNDLAAAERVFHQLGDDIAGLIIEPVAGNMGCIMPKDGYLNGLQELCQKYDALFILDEVMTGFRVHPNCAQGLWNLQPDLTCLGKVIGGGLPVGAFGGRKDIMEKLAPLGPVYQAGTLSGNPLAMAAGIATLKTGLSNEGENTSDIFHSVTIQTSKLIDGIASLAKTHDIPLQTNVCGSMFGFTFIKDHSAPIIHNFETAQTWNDVDAYGSFFRGMLERGVFFAPSAYEAGFLSSAHNDKVIRNTLDKIDACFSSLSI